MRMYIGSVMTKKAAKNSIVRVCHSGLKCGWYSGVSTTIREITIAIMVQISANNCFVFAVKGKCLPQINNAFLRYLNTYVRIFYPNVPSRRIWVERRKIVGARHRPSDYEDFPFLHVSYDCHYQCVNNQH